jgi:hypothetical protein
MTDAQGYRRCGYCSRRFEPQSTSQAYCCSLCRAKAAWCREQERKDAKNAATKAGTRAS